ncbi:hypothetical protein FH972_015211 [Carpinus fangiana]|uniref:Uncharacterized protein n=1 Tax=Carpinus fangiana TaxID=176857 RepID=A0A5N6RFN0_9ROSI|nr:hypothetical protein FH972_015211 [Carpinus fangiana]
MIRPFIPPAAAHDQAIHTFCSSSIYFKKLAQVTNLRYLLQLLMIKQSIPSCS